MFYCVKCQEKNNWPGIIPLSYGPCEVCGKTAPCFDMPVSKLPDK